MSEREKFLGLLVAVQASTAPVSLSIGHVARNQVRHNSIVIHEGPPAVLKAVSQWVDGTAGVNAEIIPTGLLITFNEESS
jgi:hypothetical protein